MSHETFNKSIGLLINKRATVGLHSHMRGSRKFSQRGSNFDNVCFVVFSFLMKGVGESKYHYKRAIII